MEKKSKNMSKSSLLRLVALTAILFQCSFANIVNGQLKGGEESETSSRNLHPVGTCGEGNVGSGICEDPSLCCSEWGYCGTSALHCRLCGEGQVGNGKCEDPSLCCSQYGFCGTGTDYCGGSGPTISPLPQPTNPTLQPTPTPITPTTPTSNHRDEDSRLIAYLGNWQACPSDAQLEQYTHIVIAFAVSYQWSSSGNICSQTCEIAMPFVCDNSYDPNLIQEWKSMGKKVILSFGGAGMGGSWEGNKIGCWDYCFGRENQVIDRLDTIVREMGVDGVDIDYEYYYEDDQNESDFSKGEEAQKFLKDITIGLREKLPEGAELTHAPMDPDLVSGTAYFNLLKEVSSYLDFLMPQYYNGNVKPLSNFVGALSHFENLKNEMFGGDAKKIVFGFCINDCLNFNLSGSDSASVMKELALYYPCNGGAFFWVVNDDANAQWSTPVSTQLRINSAQCSNINPVTPRPSLAPFPAPTGPPSLAPFPAPTGPPSLAPFPAPTGPPTRAPFPAPTSVPTSVPVFPPSSSPESKPTSAPQDECVNDPDFLYKNKRNKNCKWVKKKRRKRCRKKQIINGIKKQRLKVFCPKACRMCK